MTQYSYIEVLRAKGLVSHNRPSQNGRWHQGLAATLVLAHEKDIYFALPARSRQTLDNKGVSSSMVSFLDAAAKEEILISQSTDFTARRRLSLGDIINADFSYEVEAA